MCRMGCRTTRIRPQPCDNAGLVCIAAIGPKRLCHQAPLLTFDGTLISDMGFGTLTAQVLSASNLRVRSADNPKTFGTRPIALDSRVERAYVGANRGLACAHLQPS